MQIILMLFLMIDKAVIATCNRGNQCVSQVLGRVRIREEDPREVITSFNRTDLVNVIILQNDLPSAPRHSSLRLASRIRLATPTADLGRPDVGASGGSDWLALPGNGGVLRGEGAPREWRPVTRNTMARVSSRSIDHNAVPFCSTGGTAIDLFAFTRAKIRKSDLRSDKCWNTPTPRFYNCRGLWKPQTQNESHWAVNMKYASPWDTVDSNLNSFTLSTFISSSFWHKYVRT
jgi:hypothetical protein